jgi:hypothetical protein
MCMHVCVHKFMYVCICTYLAITNKLLYIYLYVYTYIHTHTHTYYTHAHTPHIHTCMVCLYVYVCVCVCVYIYIYIYIHTHTYIHIHHIYQTRSWRRHFPRSCPHILHTPDSDLSYTRSRRYFLRISRVFLHGNSRGNFPRNVQPDKRKYILRANLRVK